MIEIIFLKNIMKIKKSFNKLFLAYWRHCSEIFFWKQSSQRISRSDCGYKNTSVPNLEVLQLGSIKRPSIANLAW